MIGPFSRRSRTALADYLSLMRWVVADVFRSCRRTTSLALALGFIAVQFEVAAMMVVIALGRAVESKGPLPLPSWAPTIHPDTANGFMAVGAMIVVLLSAGAALRLLAKLRALALWRDYQTINAVRVAERLPYLPHPDAPEASRRLGRRAINSLISRDARYAGVTAYRAIGAVLPFIYFVSIIAALLVMSPGLTIMCGMIALVGARLITGQNRAAARATLAVEACASEASRARRRRIELGLQEGDEPAAVDKAFRRGVVHDQVVAITGRIRAIEISEAFARMLGVTAIAAVFVFTWVVSDSEDPAWASTIAYLVALTAALNRFGGVIRTLTSLNRFVPQLRRLSRFIIETAPLVDAPPPGPPIPRPVQLAIRRLDATVRADDDRPSDGARLELDAGARLWLPVNDWSALAAVVSLRAGRNGERTPLWPGCVKVLTEDGVTEHPAARGVTDADVAAALGQDPGPLAPLARVMLGSARHVDDPRLVVIGQHAARGLDREQLSSAAALAGSRDVLLLADIGHGPLSGADPALVWDGRRIVGWIDAATLLQREDLLALLPVADEGTDDDDDDDDL